MSEEPKAQVPVLEQVGAMPPMFWIANGSEMLERLAFFGVRAVLPLYMFGADSVLGLSMTQKGIIFGGWALIQCLLPMISGGYTEAYGYRKSLSFAFVLNGLGYRLMAHTPDLVADWDTEPSSFSHTSGALGPSPRAPDVCENEPGSVCAGRPARRREWKSLTVKGQPPTPAPSHAFPPARVGRRYSRPGGEALTGVRIGRASSRERRFVRGG